MLIHRYLIVLILLTLSTLTSSFVPHFLTRASPVFKTHTASTLNAEKQKPALPQEVKQKLLAESIAPWRTLRLFLYASFGSGAFVGLLITLSNLSAPDSMKTSDPDSNLLLNAGVNFIATAAFATAAYFDAKKGKELEGKVDAKFARKLVQKEEEKESQKIWSTASSYPIKLNSGLQSLKSLNDKRLSVVFVSGNGGFIKETLLNARLNKEVIKTNGLILATPDNGGFSKMEEYTSTYDNELLNVMKGEVEKAKEQGAKVEDGVVVVVGREGKVVRRGIGRVDFRKVCSDILGEN